jgi:hypothetical protein
MNYLKYILLLFVIVLGLDLSASGRNYSDLLKVLLTDTLPPGPPVQHSQLQGPSQSCVGYTSTYTIDIPVACSCQWSVNGIIQPGDSDTLAISWTEAGMQTIGAAFVCNGQTVLQGTLDVIVNSIPLQPLQIDGDTSVCEYTYHTYTTTVSPYDLCEWEVNEIVQPVTGPVMTYSFGAGGIYTIGVTAYNNCGTSNPRFLEVYASGVAPDPPSPVQGPVESCTGNTETYTTTVNPGEICEWRINNILQPTTSPTLVVTWLNPGWSAIEVRAVSGCGTGNPASLEVNVQYVPVVELGEDTSIYQGQSLLLDAGNPGCHYEWSTGDSSRYLIVTQSGLYSVNVWSYCGSASDDIEVSVIVGIPTLTDNQQLNIYAANRHIFIDETGIAIEKIEILSVYGQLVLHGQTQTSVPIINPGIYIVRILTNQGQYIRKILVM